MENFAEAGWRLEQSRRIERHYRQTLSADLPRDSKRPHSGQTCRTLPNPREAFVVRFILARSLLREFVIEEIRIQSLRHARSRDRGED